MQRDLKTEHKRGVSSDRSRDEAGRELTLPRLRQLVDRLCRLRKLPIKLGNLKLRRSELLIIIVGSFAKRKLEREGRGSLASRARDGVVLKRNRGTGERQPTKEMDDNGGSLRSPTQ